MPTTNIKDEELHEVSNIRKKNCNDDNIVKEHFVHSVVKEHITLSNDHIIFI